MLPGLEPLRPGLVQCSLVHMEAWQAILLGHKQNGSPGWCCGGWINPILQILCDSLLGPWSQGGSIFTQTESVILARYRWVNHMSNVKEVGPPASYQIHQISEFCRERLVTEWQTASLRRCGLCSPWRWCRMSYNTGCPRDLGCELGSPLETCLAKVGGTQ